MHAGEKLDWGAFFQLYRPAAVRFARGLLREISLAEDVVHDAARALYERAETDRISFQSREHARNYFFRTVQNLAVGVVRSASRASSSVSEGAEERISAGEDPLDALLAQEASLVAARAERDLLGAIAALRPEERNVLRMRYGDGLAFREIAERTGEPISTLHARVEAALGKIRKRIGKPGGDA